MVIALVATVIGGASMAWFTAKTDLPAVEFTAGTVLVGAELKAAFEGGIENVNPGDCYCVGWNITNDGTKCIQVRALNITIEVEYAWEHLFENWDALCFTETFGEEKPSEMSGGRWRRFKAWVEGHAIPVTLDVCPGYSYNWTKVEDKFYYVGHCEQGLCKDEMIQLGLFVMFDGPTMTNVFQGAKFTISGRVEAVQASNGAPLAVWGKEWCIAKPEACPASA